MGKRVGKSIKTLTWEKEMSRWEWRVRADANYGGEEYLEVFLQGRHVASISRTRGGACGLQRYNPALLKEERYEYLLDVVKDINFMIATGMLR